MIGGDLVQCGAMKNAFRSTIIFALAALLGCGSEEPEERAPLYVVDPVTAQHAPLYHRGKLSWAALAAVTTERESDAAAPKHRFREDVFELRGKRVKLRGYMIPLKVAEKHTRFLLSPDPQGCPYCSPGGPALALEAHAAEPMMHDFNAIVVEGVFEINPDAPDDLVYRLNEVKRLN